MFLFDIESSKLTPIVEVLVDPTDKIHKQLTHIESDLGKVRGVIDAVEPGASVKLSPLEGYEERINGLKMELFQASQGILALDHADSGLTDRESYMYMYIRDELFRAYSTGQKKAK